MKLGKQPKRFGGPSAKFLARKAGLSADGKTINAQAPKEGSVHLFLDDDRPCPAGWTVARSAKAFFELIDAIGPNRIETISLDWYLGACTPNGEAVAEQLLDLMRKKPDLFSKLELIRFHSSDRKMAIAMMRTLEEPLREGWESLPFFATALGLPDYSGADLNGSAAKRAHDRRIRRGY